MREEIGTATFIDAVAQFDEMRVRAIKREISMKYAALRNTFEEACDRHRVPFGFDECFEFAGALNALADHLGVRLMLKPGLDRLTPHMLSMYVEECSAKFREPTPEVLMELFAIRFKREAEQDPKELPPPDQE